MHRIRTEGFLYGVALIVEMQRFTKLLLDLGADPRIADNDGRTPLDVAIYYMAKRVSRR